MKLNPLKQVKNKTVQMGGMALCLAICSASAYAEYKLPTAVSTVSSGNYITMMGQAFAELADLLINVFNILAMVIMGGLFVWEFIQVNQGKKTWGNLTVTMGVGGLTLVVVYILLTTASGNNGDGLSFIESVASGVIC